jgi:hypothetical protein
MKNVIIVGFMTISFLSYSQSEFNSKEGVIETPEIQVFYEAIPIEISAQALGYKEVRLSVPNPYTAPIGSAGSIITVQCTGITLKGKEVPLGAKKFTVKKAPKPGLYWNDVTDGEVANKLAGSLVVRYDDNVPFTPAKGSFTVESYTISVSGLKGTLDGEGSEISELHLEALKNITKGSKIAIQVKYTGTSTGFLSAMFEL